MTQRETIAVRGDRLALTRIENSRWSVEQLDDHDRLTRVTVFPHDDLLGAANALDDVARPLPENAHIPGWVWEFQRDIGTTTSTPGRHTLDDEFGQIDYRPLGYAPMGNAELIDLIRTGPRRPDVAGGAGVQRDARVVEGGGLVEAGCGCVASPTTTGPVSPISTQ